MTASHPHSPVRVECWHRVDDPATLDRVAEVQCRLERLAADGRIDGLDVRPWPRRVPVRSGPGPIEPVLERVRAFERWADRTDRSLRPGIDRRELWSTIDGARAEVVVLPVVCLALLDGDDVLEIVPSRKGTEVTTVGDCLDRLEDGRRIRPARAPQ